VKLSPQLRRRAGRQDGYVLLVIMVMLTLMLLAMTVAAPYVVTQVKRDREEELIHRGRSYARAVKLYFKKFGRYPSTLKELENTNNIRFIRKLYKDPVTKDGEWRIIHLGEAKFFPKGFGFSSVATGQGGGAPGGALLPGGVGGVLGAAPGGGQAAANPLGSNQPSTGGMTPAEQMSRPIGTGATFGGGPIIGVASKNTDRSIHEVNERAHYNEWEFFYDPRFDLAVQLVPGAANLPGQSGPGGQQQGPARK